MHYIRTDSKSLYHFSFLKDIKVNGVFISSVNQYLQNYPYMRKEHYHDFYSILFFKTGNGLLRINNMSYAVKPYSLFLIPPSQLHSLDNVSGTEGIVFFFCQDYYVEEFSYIRLLKVFSFVSNLDQAGQNHSVALSQEESEIMAGLFVSVSNEYDKQVTSDISSVVIRSLLNIILMKLYEIFERKSVRAANTESVLIHELSYIIDMYFTREHNTSFYASALSVTEKQVNETCNRYFNNSLKKILTDRLMQEARRLLLSTDMTISEISYKLNFSDDSYFNKVFRKQTSLTPKRFREIHRKILP